MNDTYIVTIGRPSYQKNPLFLVEVIKGVHDRHPEVKFMLLGVGYYSPDLDQMKQKISEYGLGDVVILKEWLSHDETLNLVKDSLFYLTVSRYEGLPLAVVEAMALGKCIVASDVVGNSDCVRNGYNGLLLSLDVDTFVEAICGLLDNPQQIKAFGDNSRTLYESEFNIRNRIAMLEDIYKEVANKKAF